MAEFGMDMPEDLVHRYKADSGMQLWGYNQRLIFLDEEIAEARQRLRNLERRRSAQFDETLKRMEAYYDIRRDNASD